MKKIYYEKSDGEKELTKKLVENRDEEARAISGIRDTEVSKINVKITKTRRAIEDIEMAKSMGLEISEFY